MPTDDAATWGGDEPTAPGDDDLVFATQDLGRDRPSDSGVEHGELGFEPVARTEERAPVTAPPRDTAVDVPEVRPRPGTDGFVIRDADVAPASPVDAIVVGGQDAHVETEPADDAPAETASAAPVNAPPRRFRIIGAGVAATTDGADPPWTVRDAAPEPSAAQLRRGWGMRQSGAAGRSAHATLLRLREEAVDISWESAWVAVTTADPRLARRRHRNGDR